MQTFSADQFPHAGDGIYEGVPAEVYHAHGAISASKLTLLAKSPAHFRYAMDNPQPSTGPQIIGEAVHKAVLEPDVFASYYTTTSLASRRSKAYDKLVEEAGGPHRVLLQKELDEVLAMRDAINASAVAGVHLKRRQNTFVEVTLLHTYEAINQVTGEEMRIPLKARLDSWCLCDVVDLKTTRDASPDGFAKALYDYGYYRQMAFYLYMAAVVSGQIDQRDLFEAFFIAVEKSPPYPVVTYRLDRPSLKAGWEECVRLLERYHTCQSTNTWPGYAVSELPLTLPHWAWNKLKA